jgi:hypothetical protein
MAKAEAEAEAYTKYSNQLLAPRPREGGGTAAFMYFI